MRSDFEELKRFAIADILSVSGRQKTTETVDMHINTIIDIAFLKGQQASQSKVDELQVKLNGAEERALTCIKYKDKYLTERDWLQKENAALVHVIKSRDIQLENEKHEYDELMNKLVDSGMKNAELQKQNAWLSGVAERENKRANNLQQDKTSTTILLGKTIQEKNELTKQRDSFIKAYEIEMDKSVDLQKRLDAAKQLIEDLNKCYQQDHQNKFEYWRGFADSAGILGKRLEQALKGGRE